MKYNKGIAYCSKTRRQFLIGSGKTLLTLPLLPSLLSRQALAQVSQSPRRMMSFIFEHNNLTELWPLKSVATTAVGNAGIRERTLQSMGTLASHSYALSNSRYETLKNANQVTYLRGFRQDGWDGCHGNMYLAAGGGRDSSARNLPTIDAVFESSTSLYPTGTPQSVRKALRVNFDGGGSYFYQRVGGNTQALPSYQGYQIQNFYNEVFGSLTGGTTPVVDYTNQLKSNILNRVYDAYTSFRGNRKISSDDQLRLTQHMDFISDLQASYASVNPTPVITCTRPAAPGNIGGNPVQYLQVYLDLMAVAFRCGLSKSGTLVFEAHDPQWIPNLGVSNFHDAIHGGQGAPNQLTAFRNWWKYNCDVIADRFIAPLQELEGDTGRTYIDNMITALLATGSVHPNQAGNDGGHGGYDSQQILIGSMGGRIRSGRYYNLEVNNEQYPYNGFLVTMLQLMGIPPSEYAYATANGLGFGSYSGYSANYAFRNRFYTPINELLT